MRHRYVYATFPRAYSKSFLSMMVLMLRCILYPNSHLFVTTGGKEQAASITIAKIQEICRLIPPLENEINWERGVSKKTKDDVHYVFKNGSQIDILAAKESSRGQRRTGGLMEECVLIDGDILNEVIIPTTNVDRLLPDGTRHKEENVNKSQIYITTAGWKNSFAYEKLIQLLIQSIVEPDQCMIMGGTYETPVKKAFLTKILLTSLNYKVRIMMTLLIVSIEVSGAAMQKMLFIQQKSLISIESLISQNMNTAREVISKLTILSELTLAVLDVQQRLQL